MLFQQECVMRPHSSILWRRLDLEGHDACLLSETDDGWKLKGHALFVHDSKPCRLAYDIDCDAGWQARSQAIHRTGWRSNPSGTTKFQPKSLLRAIACGILIIWLRRPRIQHPA